jgi:hypothetical protein
MNLKSRIEAFSIRLSYKTRKNWITIFKHPIFYVKVAVAYHFKDWIDSPTVRRIIKIQIAEKKRIREIYYV